MTDAQTLDSLILMTRHRLGMHGNAAVEDFDRLIAMLRPDVERFRWPDDHRAAIDAARDALTEPPSGEAP